MAGGMAWMKKAWNALGPGLITGAADDDPSGIGTYSVAGAQFGYGMLWLTLICLPLMFAVQEMCARIGVLTGQGLAANLKKHYANWILWVSVAILLAANVFNVYADLNVMAASLKMLFGANLTIWLVLVAVFSLGLMVLDPYRSYSKYLKYLCLSLLAYIVVAFLPKTGIEWPRVFQRTIIPSWEQTPAFALTVVGFLGTTISPYLFFWQADEEVEEEIEQGLVDEAHQIKRRPGQKEIRKMRADTFSGMALSQVITFFIVVTTAATLGKSGKTNISTARDAAAALLPLGHSAYWLFTLGIIGTGLLAIPTLVGSAGYAVAQTFGWPYGLNKHASKAKAFYSTIAILFAIAFLMNFTTSISPVKSLLYSAVLNGIAAPPLIVLLLLMCNNAKVVGRRTNSALSNWLGGLAALLMGLAAAIFIWYFAHGQAG